MHKLIITQGDPRLLNQNDWTRYQTTDYHFIGDADDALYQTSFVGLALLKRFRDQKIDVDELIIMGSTTSAWQAWLEEGLLLGGKSLDDDQRLALWEQIEPLTGIKNKGVERSHLSDLEEYLSSALALKVHCIVMPIALSEGDQFHLLRTLNDLFDPGDSLTLDMTHGLRFMPILQLFAAQLLEHNKRVKVRDVFYGSFTGEVNRLNGMMELVRWKDALLQFSTNFDTSGFRSLMPSGSQVGKLIDQLGQQLGFLQIKVASKTAGRLKNEWVRLDPKPAGGLFTKAIEVLWNWRKESLHFSQYEIGLIFLKHGDYVRALILWYEALVEGGRVARSFSYQGRTTHEKFESRKKFESEELYDVFDELRSEDLLKHSEFQELKKLRNTLCHGGSDLNPDLDKLQKQIGKWNVKVKRTLLAFDRLPSGSLD